VKKTLTPVLPEIPAIASIDTAYKAADKAITDAATALTTRVTAEEKATTDNKAVQDTAISVIDTKIAAVKTTADASAKQADLTTLTSRVTTAEKAITDNKSAADTAIAAVKTTADKARTDLSALTSTVSSNKTSQDSAISSAIAEWGSARAYKINNICIKNKTFFIALIDNVGKDPLVDASGAWGVFNPGSSSDIFANRSPTNKDVQPVGTKFWDVSFGADTPLGFLSLGNGAWQFLNQISLSRIRFSIQGNANTYRSNLNNLKIYKSDGTVIPNSWLVWGAGNVTKPQAGVAFTGQSMQAQYSSNGWAELEPSAQFDTSISISKITGNLYYQGCSQIQFFYSNGGVKTYTSGASTGSTLIDDVNLITCDPPLKCRFGDSIASVMGETLTAAQLANSADKNVGRLTGESFVSAFNQLYQAQSQVLAAYQQETIDALTARIAALEAR
jgi:hypothetical protein